MVDLHSHILPNIDDGSKSIEETLKMGRIAMEEGFSKIIATPHYIEGAFEIEKEKLIETINSVNKALIKEGIEIEVLIGSEVYISPNLPTKLVDGDIITLNNGPYILIEFPMRDIPVYTEDILYEIRLLGYRPIIAHPERYEKIIENPNILKNFIQQGNYAQVNSLSIIGVLGERAKETAEILLKHKMIHFIGTDAHSSKRRSPKIQKGLDQMREWIGNEETQKIIDNGIALLKGKEVHITQPRTYIHKKNFLDKMGKLLLWKKDKVYE